MQGKLQSDIVKEVLSELERVAKTLKKVSSSQVRSVDELQIIQATVHAWFNNHKVALGNPNGPQIDEIDAGYTELFAYSNKATSRKKYLEQFKGIRHKLHNLQLGLLGSKNVEENFTDSQLDFSSLVNSIEMKAILESRLDEISKCLHAKAPLAATVMIGGLLEALFLARANKLDDKSLLFKAVGAPKDKVSKKPLPLDKWTLSSYIEVGAELGWIRKPAKEVGVVLRDYRNFIHPERERSTGFTIGNEDAEMFWQILNQLSFQIIASVKNS